MIDPPTNPTLCPDAGTSAPAKPCARRMTIAGKQAWCILDARHRDPLSEHYNPDCAGVTPREMPQAFAALDPKRRPQWG